MHVYSHVLILATQYQYYTGNFRGRKPSQIGEKYDFCGENFHGLLAFAAPKVPHPQILQRKLSRIATKTTKFVKVFSLESFPLYGTSPTAKQKHSRNYYKGLHAEIHSTTMN